MELEHLSLYSNISGSFKHCVLCYTRQKWSSYKHVKGQKYYCLGYLDWESFKKYKNKQLNIKNAIELNRLITLALKFLILSYSIMRPSRSTLIIIKLFFLMTFTNTQKFGHNLFMKQK